jgi:hypothetical protein
MYIHADQLAIAKFCSTDSSRPVLNCVRFDPATLSSVATDGCQAIDVRLTGVLDNQTEEYPCGVPTDATEPTEDVLIPKELALRVCKAIDAKLARSFPLAGYARLLVSGETLYVCVFSTIDTSTVFTCPIDSHVTFPDVSQVWPSGDDKGDSVLSLLAESNKPRTDTLCTGLSCLRRSQCA